MTPIYSISTYFAIIACPLLHYVYLNFYIGRRFRDYFSFFVLYMLDLSLSVVAPSFKQSICIVYLQRKGRIWDGISTTPHFPDILFLYNSALPYSSIRKNLITGGFIYFFVYDCSGSGSKTKYEGMSFRGGLVLLGILTLLSGCFSVGWEDGIHLNYRF